MPYIAPAFNPDPQVKPLFPCSVDWNHPLSRGLVGCWLFNERSGTVVYDLVRGIPGTFSGDDIKWQNDVIYIGESEDRIIAPFPMNDYLYPKGTIEFHVIFKWSPTTTNWPVFFDTYGGDNQRFVLYYASDTDKFNLWSAGVDRGVTNVWTGSAEVPYHMAITWPTNDFYINGVLYHSFGDGGLDLGATTLYIGDRYTNANSSLNGLLKYFRIWNCALTQPEIQSLYQSPYQFIRPVVPMPYWIAAAAPAAGIPKHWDYYRQMRARA